MNKKIIIAIISILIASILPSILFEQLSGSIPSWLSLIQIIIISILCIMCIIIEELKSLVIFYVVLLVYLLVDTITSMIKTTNIWENAFSIDDFTNNIGSSILLKYIAIIPTIIVLLILLKSPKMFFLTKGDLNVKAEKIIWLGIKGNKITWGKLAIISGLLISLGTFILTVITALDFSSFTNFINSFNLVNYIKYLPFILLFALTNSFVEGLLFRNAIIGSLHDRIPKKYVVLISAFFFGIGHFYGIPSGYLGAVMSMVLGWYLARSMYETKGFVSSWIIHLMQDFVIFSTICLFK